jgi:hypothetical protein
MTKSTVFVAVSIILMTLPFGIPVTYDYSGPPDFETVTVHYSYFSGIHPFGGGNLFPSLTAVFAIAALIFQIIAIWKKSKMATVLVCLSLAITTNTASWIMFKAFSFVGLLVMILHLIVVLPTLYKKIKPK